MILCCRGNELQVSRSCVPFRLNQTVPAEALLLFTLHLHSSVTPLPLVTPSFYSPPDPPRQKSLIPSFTPSDPHQCLRGHGGGAENPPPRCSAPLLPTIPLCLPTNRPTDQPTNQTQNFLARVQETAAPKKEEEAEDGNLERACCCCCCALDTIIKTHTHTHRAAESNSHAGNRVNCISLIGTVWESQDKQIHHRRRGRRRGGGLGGEESRRRNPSGDVRLLPSVNVTVSGISGSPDIAARTLLSRPVTFQMFPKIAPSSLGSIAEAERLFAAAA